MGKKSVKLTASFFIVILCFFPKAGHAVIPPDFIFTIGTQVAQFFSLIIVFFTVVFGAFFQFFKTLYYKIKHKKLVLALTIFLIISGSLSAAYFYAGYAQKSAYQKWLKESQEYSSTQNAFRDSDGGLPKDSDEVTNEDNSNDSAAPVGEVTVAQESDFFEKNTNVNLFITNQDFKNSTDSQQSTSVVLDARENIEYENGYFPGSVHIRFADLKAGRWTELPKDIFIYVMCWSGIRGKEVAEFLRTKKIVASYVEEGANGWVEFGGKWIGDIQFGEKYTDSRYQRVFTTEDVKSKVKDGVILIDTREPYTFAQWHISGSINIPIMHTPTIDLEKTFNQVPRNSKIITVCDGYVNCFDAKLTGVELERRGHQFLGRYNKPWEYEQ